jgi:hypothetical protein
MDKLLELVTYVLPIEMTDYFELADIKVYLHLIHRIYRNQ